MKFGILLLLFCATVGAQPVLRDVAAQRGILVGAAAASDEFGVANRLLETNYADTLGKHFGVLEPENAMKFGLIHPDLNRYNWSPTDKLVAFASANKMLVRGHTLVWHSQLPNWLTNAAKTATPAEMSKYLEDHIREVVGHYKGKVYAWDVVNEAIADNATSNGTLLRSTVWSDSPGIGLRGTAYIEQAFRWAHDADPYAKLFYNDYSIEGTGGKFSAMLNMVRDFVARGVPIHGVGMQMHLLANNSPSSSGLSANLKFLADLGLEVHITEMDVRVPVDANGVATAANLKAQADTYARIATVCVQAPNCTLLQTWGFTDKYSWIPGFAPGFGAALLFDANYVQKPAYTALMDTFQSLPPGIVKEALVSAASYQGGPIAPGQLVTLFGAGYGPATLQGAALAADGKVATSLGGARLLFDGIPAPLLYATYNQTSAVVPFELTGKAETRVEYEMNGIRSNALTLPVGPVAPAVFAANATGAGAGLILNADYTLNTTDAPASAGAAIQVLATGGGAYPGALTGALAAGAAPLPLAVTATIGGRDAKVLYAGAAPGLIHGVLQINLEVPAGLGAGSQPIQFTINGKTSQARVTVALR